MADRPPTIPRPPVLPATDAGDERRLLELFPQERRSAVANLFLNRLRIGAPPCGYAADAPWTPDMLRVAVLMDLTERLRHAFRNGYHDTYTRVAETIAILNRNQEATLDYAGWAIAWESLPRDERERRKQDRGEGYARAAMDKQQPTEKQVAYLQRMGYAGPIDSKSHASSLIDLYTRGQRVVS